MTHSSYSTETHTVLLFYMHASEWDFITTIFMSEMDV